MITKEEFEKAVEVCTDGNMNCTQCSLGKRFYKCGVYFTRYIKENEPALSANSTSSEILKNINSHTLMIAQKSRFVKHTKLLMKLVKI